MSIMGIYLLLLTIVIATVSTSEIAIRNDKCKHCQFMVATFEAGLRSTSRQHFSGGDTAWEEKNLGKYSTSETRLVEVLEGICKKNTVSDNSKFTYLKDVEFKCNELLEEHEELLETYYYKHQEENMTIWMCVDNLKVCCPPGHYGKECTKCPGLQQGFATCFGHGKCHGDESRQGIGKCKCDQGYTGLYCQHCDSDYFASKQDENSIECEKCFTACVGGCTGAGPKGCTRCRSGWDQNEELGCVDVDECAREDACTGSNAKCVNTEGSFTCECMDGYMKNEEGQCELNIQASAYHFPIAPDLLLRTIAWVALVGIVAIVYVHRSTTLVVLTALAVVAIILIELYVNPDTLPDQAKSLLQPDGAQMYSS